MFTIRDHKYDKGGVLADAQAVGDLQALKAAKRRAVRVHLGSNVEVGLRRLADEVA